MITIFCCHQIRLLNSSVCFNSKCILRFLRVMKNVVYDNNSRNQTGFYFRECPCENPVYLRVFYGGYCMHCIRNATPRTESLNDFCSFRRVVWLKFLHLYSPFMFQYFNSSNFLLSVGLKGPMCVTVTNVVATVQQLQRSHVKNHNSLRMCL